MIQLFGFFLMAIGIIGMGISAKSNEKILSVKKSLSLGKAAIPAVKIKMWIKQHPVAQALKPKNWIKKILLKTKIFFLKCENKIDGWLKKVSQSKKFNSDYWDKLKKK